MSAPDRTPSKPYMTCLCQSRGFLRPLSTCSQRRHSTERARAADGRRGSGEAAAITPHRPVINERVAAQGAQPRPDIAERLDAAERMA
eukprot:3874703-Rhodomonas_salina.1